MLSSHFYTGIQPFWRRYAAATRPPHDRHATATRPPRAHHVAATRPPHDRHTTATRPPRDCHVTATWPSRDLLAAARGFVSVRAGVGGRACFLRSSRAAGPSIIASTASRARCYSLVKELKRAPERELAPGVIAALNERRDQAGAAMVKVDHATLLEGQLEARRAVNSAIADAKDERELYAARQSRKASRRKRVGSV